MMVSSFRQSLYREPLRLSAGVTSTQHRIRTRVTRRYPSFIAHTGSCARPKSSHPPRFYPCTVSLRRMLRAPAGSRPFPTLSLRIFLYVQGPLPRLLLWCFHPFLPTRLRPYQRRHPVGALAEIHALATSAWGTYRGCSHLMIFKPVDLLATPIAPTVTPLDIRQPWLLLPRISQFVTSLSRGYANRLNRTIGGRGTSTLLDPQPCRLLRRPSRQNRLANATAVVPRPPCVRRAIPLPVGTRNPTAPTLA